MIFKLVISVVLITAFVFLQSCKKGEQICNGNKEIKSTNHLVDISVLKTVPQMLDSLAKYKELQVDKIVNDEYMTSVCCNYFSNGLIVFNASYALIKSKKFNFFICEDYRPKVTIPTNLAKNIDYRKALEIAKNEINFSGSCLSYQLGYYYSDTSEILTPASFKLVWSVKEIDGGAYVFLDAGNGKVYSKFDGRYN
jgi:hypothetical protein